MINAFVMTSIVPHQIDVPSHLKIEHFFHLYPSLFVILASSLKVHQAGPQKSLQEPDINFIPGTATGSSTTKRS